MIVDAETAAEFSQIAHKGQTRWDGSDYFENHVQQIVDMMREDLGPRDIVDDGETVMGAQVDVVLDRFYQVAYLHDVIEDTQYTREDLYRAGFTPMVVQAVEAISKISDSREDYWEYIGRVKVNSIATVVKVYDIQNNLQDIMDNYPEKTDKIKKYETALSILMAAV